MTNFKIDGRFSCLYRYIRRKETTVWGEDSNQWSAKIIFHENFKLRSVVKAKRLSSGKREGRGRETTEI